MFFKNKSGTAKFRVIKNSPAYLLQETESKQIITVEINSLKDDRTAKHDESGRIAKGEILDLKVFMKDGRWDVSPLNNSATPVLEDSHTELKSLGINSLEQDVAGMANGFGGKICWGVKDNGEVIGIDDLINQYKGEDALACMLRNKLRQNLNTLLFLSVEFNFTTREGKRILEIKVPKSDKIVLVRGCELYVRSGETTQHLEADLMLEYICNRFKK